MAKNEETKTNLEDAKHELKDAHNGLMEGDFDYFVKEVGHAIKAFVAYVKNLTK